MLPSFHYSLGYVFFFFSFKFQGSFKTPFLCELSPGPEGNLRTEITPPSSWVSSPRKHFTQINGASLRASNLWYPHGRRGTVPGAAGTTPCGDAGGQMQKGLENCTDCGASQTKPGVTALEQILRRNQGSLHSGEAQDK